jgi:hypothetical protein
MTTNDYRSQFLQDIFALTTAKNKTYIEIGASWPEKISNTFILEKNNWQGFSIELNSKKVDKWFEEPVIRKNKIYCDNAITFDYNNALKENNLPLRIGYLSCDIEPPENTFAALKKVIEQGITFDCITFEHDNYQSEVDFNPIATEYLLKKGYKIAVSNVYVLERYRIEGQKKKAIKKSFLETWYVAEDINFPETTYDTWLKSITKS